MADILESRQKIDEIDRGISSLFIKRMEAAREIADYKVKHGMGILDKKREEEKLEALKKDVPCEMSYYIGELYKRIFELSREYQKEQMDRNGSGL